ncbi:hypothetical protein [Streptomyces malaysiensis]|uniref:Uncharacterized protein n=1 Tax=Streptomyces malaysiensis subsp. samsunensis TaxID=459658 RepID=A0A9X2RVA2_STRMQ|nr:hypothetical protein [Streptomyces samsunensis]MCQ8831763.1 hypothetical protein [Streptomyces samsunensis]
MATAKKSSAAKDKAVEVEKRSADGADGTRHEKIFVLAGSSLPEQDGPEHDANKVACVQEALQRGLHPRGDVRLDGVENAADGLSRAYAYSVAMVPSAVDDQPGETTTPRKVIEGEG